LQDCGDPFQTIRADVALLGWVSVAGVLPKYFSSEWSFAQFRIPEDSRAMVAFGPQKHTVLIACANGSFYRCAFDPVQGGEMVQQEYESFKKPAENVKGVSV
jgi:hypothetical protein